MSMTVVRSYVRSRLVGLNYKEWKDGFNFDNIPMSLADKTFHIGSRKATGVHKNQTAQQIDMPIELRIFRNGFLDPATAIDKSIAEAETIINDVCKNANFLASAVKNIAFNSISIDPLVGNDNALVLTINLTALVIIAV